MAITVEDIKKLKELTGVGLTDAKAALTEADGDFDKALEAMRKKGITKAEKRGEREARARRDQHREQLGRVPGRVLARALVSPALGVAIGACVLAAIAFVVAVLTWRRLRSVRRGQQAILGGSTADVVEFAVSLQGRIDDLHRAVDEVAVGLTRVDRRLDGAVTNTSVVRYDAYGDAGGQQSASFAFLDAHRTGTIVTAIQGRDYARVYVKELERGRPSLALSPEEAEAVERAMAR